MVRKILLHAIWRIARLIDRRGLAFFAHNPVLRRNYRRIVSQLVDHRAPVSVGPHKMYVDPVDTLKLSMHGLWKSYETDVIAAHIQTGDTVVDVGAHIGYFTLLAAKSVGAQGKVIAFEPDPTNYSILMKNIVLNGYHQVVVYQKAVSRDTGRCRLYIDPVNGGGHRIYATPDKRESVEVEVVSLDEYLGAERVDFIKMDMEGSEWLAIQGMKSILANNPQVKIFTEYAPCLLRSAGIEPARYMEMLCEYGFTILNVKEQECRLEPMTLDESDRLERQLRGTDLLCLRNIGKSGRSAG